MATRGRIGRPESKLTSAVTIATPAEGPSFGTRADGTWMWNVCFLRSQDRCRSVPHWLAPCERRSHRLASPRQMSGHVKLLAPRMRLALDKTMFRPAGSRPIPPKRRASDAFFDFAFGAEFWNAERLVHHSGVT